MSISSLSVRDTETVEWENWIGGRAKQVGGDVGIHGEPCGVHGASDIRETGYERFTYAAHLFEKPANFGDRHRLLHDGAIDVVHPEARSRVLPQNRRARSEDSIDYLAMEVHGPT